MEERLFFVSYRNKSRVECTFYRSGMCQSCRDVITNIFDEQCDCQSKFRVKELNPYNSELEYVQSLQNKDGDDKILNFRLRERERERERERDLN